MFISLLNCALICYDIQLTLKPTQWDKIVSFSWIILFLSSSTVSISPSLFSPFQVFSLNPYQPTHEYKFFRHTQKQIHEDVVDCSQCAVVSLMSTNVSKAPQGNTLSLLTLLCGFSLYSSLSHYSIIVVVVIFIIITLKDCCLTVLILSWEWGN